MFLVAEVLYACINDVSVMQLACSHDLFVILLSHSCLRDTKEQSVFSRAISQSQKHCDTKLC